LMARVTTDVNYVNILKDIDIEEIKIKWFLEFKFLIFNLNKIRNLKTGNLR
jgi:hypothetical protein